jgi:hypothetical protein
MYRRKVIVATAAVFAIGVAFAAQPTSVRADTGQGVPQPESLWIPGTNMLMSSDELRLSTLTLPR